MCCIGGVAAPRSPRSTARCRASWPTRSQRASRFATPRLRQSRRTAVIAWIGRATVGAGRRAPRSRSASPSARATKITRPCRWEATNCSNGGGSRSALPRDVGEPLRGDLVPRRARLGRSANVTISTPAGGSSESDSTSLRARGRRNRVLPRVLVEAASQRELEALAVIFRLHTRLDLPRTRWGRPRRHGPESAGGRPRPPVPRERR